jgi:hypothetical protein
VDETNVIFSLIVALPFFITVGIFVYFFAVLPMRWTVGNLLTLFGVHDAARRRALTPRLTVIATVLYVMLALFALWQYAAHG